MLIFCDATNLKGREMTSSEDNKVIKHRRCRSRRPEEIYLLTRHCAQLQFKLLQILNAPLSNKLSLLQELEVGDVNLTGVDEHRIMSHRKTQKMLISRLKSQLQQLRDDAPSPDNQLVIQLKLHLSDLEHFVHFLREVMPRTRISGGTVRRLFGMLNKVRATHWGNLRADLEVAVVEVEETPKSDVEKLTSVVRDRLAMTLRDLAHHGLKSQHLHIWDLIYQVYQRLGGVQYNTEAIRCLAQSFDLDMVDARPTTALQLLLDTLGQIMITHNRYKCSKEERWKAMVCAGLNSGQLTEWLRLIFSRPELNKLYYQPWSYVTNMGFEDAIQSLNRLCRFSFDLPANFAIQHLDSIQDEFY